MGGYSTQAAAAITATITFLVLFTIAGNALVILAVLRSRSLRAPQNLFLVSLAAADILVAALIIPFSLANELMGYWYFQKTWCEIYLALDVLFCTSSIVHLCAISLDRYWAVSRAVAYGARRSPRRVKCGILLVWSIAALISLPPLLYKGEEEEEEAPGGRPQCHLNRDAWYVLSSSVASFFAPCLIMILVYLRIYLIATRRRRPGCAAGAADPAGDREPPGDPPVPPDRTSLLHPEEPVPPQPPTVPERPPEPQGCPSGAAHPRDTLATDMGLPKDTLATDMARPKDTLATDTGCPRDTLAMGTERPRDTLATGTVHPRDTPAPGTMHPRDTLATDTGCPKDTLATGTMHPRDTPALGTMHPRDTLATGRPKDTLATGTGRVALAPARVTGPWRRKAQLRRERRFTAVLAVVIGAFVLCWFPFFFLYSLGALCPRRCKVPHGVFQFFFWIGYCNSSLNPLIYTVFNADFRRAFRRLLCGRGARTAC